MTETPPIVPVSPIIPIIENQAPIENTPPTGGVTPVSELFSFGTDTSVSPPVSTPIDTPVSPIYPVSEVSDSADLSAITNDLSSAKTDLQPTPPTFQTTEDLIAHEISDLDEFILSLDEVDRAKLEQEAEYKKQKEHFAELEIEAESEHQKVLAERAHAEKMKSYLEAEIQ